MWKWLGGCLLVLLLVVVGAVWWGYQKMANTISPDGSVRVTIAASPARVFAYLSDADSAATWMARGTSVVTSRHGTFVPGDSIQIGMRSPLGAAGQQMIWQVTEVVPGQVVARQIITADPRHKFVALRRDSVAQLGDSTIVISRLTAPGQPGSTNGELALSMFRVQSKLELMSLKAQLEGTLAPRMAK